MLTGVAALVMSCAVVASRDLLFIALRCIGCVMLCWLSAIGWYIVGWTDQ